jgi:monodehydroascorbate reductase (NADH)
MSASAAKKSEESYKYVVLGGGNASGYCAKQFVEQEANAPGDICIISGEPYVSYERPALSKAYLFPESPARLPGFHTSVGGGGERQEPKWYKDKNITFKTGSRVTEASVADKTLTIADGSKVKYEKLIIATGARPVYLTDFGTENADAQGVCYLRNVQDADHLNYQIKVCKEKYGNKAVVVGGGYIGMECAAALSLNSVDTTMVFPEDHLMERLFTPGIAKFYEDYYASKGIKFIKKDLITGFSVEPIKKGFLSGLGVGGDKVPPPGTEISVPSKESSHVTKAQLKSGQELDCGLAVVGVGARPNVDVFEGQLDFAPGCGGFLVDSQMKTSDDSVYAIGDVAAFPLLMDGGKIVRQEHVMNCRLSAYQAVKSALDASYSEKYDYLPYFYSRVFDLSWVFYGSNVGNTVEFGKKVPGEMFGCFWISDKKIVGVFAEGASPEQVDKIKEIAKTQPRAPATSMLETKGLEAI